MTYRGYVSWNGVLWSLQLSNKSFQVLGFQNDIYCYLTALVERIVDRHVTYYSRNYKHTILKTPSLAVISRFMNVVSLWKWSHLCMGRLKYLKKLNVWELRAHLPQTELCGQLWCEQIARDSTAKNAEKNHQNRALMHTEETHRQMKRSWDFGWISAFAHIPGIIHYQAVNYIFLQFNAAHRI